MYPLTLRNKKKTLKELKEFLNNSIRVASWEEQEINSVNWLVMKEITPQSCKVHGRNPAMKST
jgi:hypothetical protein